MPLPQSHDELAALPSERDINAAEFVAAGTAFLAAISKYEAHIIAGNNTKHTLQFAADRIGSYASAVSNMASAAQGRLNAAAFNRPSMVRS